MKKAHIIFVIPLFILTFFTFSSQFTTTVLAADCEIPPSGPWPACATGGENNQPPSDSSGNDGCVIPESGPWPPCATNGGGQSQSPPANSGGGECVIPDSGPWPPCATSGNGGSQNQPPSSGTDDCVIPPSGPWPACATSGGGGSQTSPPQSGSGECVIPESGPWPPCASQGSGGSGTSTPPPSNPAPSQPSQQVISGNGDDLITLNRQREFQMLRISGNQASRHFAVKAYNGDDYLDLLVNTTDPYYGVVLIDTSSVIGQDHTTILEVNATGSWTIEFLSVQQAQVLQNSDSISGANDDVVAVNNGGALTVVGNSSSRHFALKAYDANGRYLDLLVNTTDNYSGTVRVPSGTRYISINAEGGWTLTYP